MGQTPSQALYQAARAGDLKGCNDARAAGGDINGNDTNHHHATPLIAAAKHGHLPVVRWLLAHGALDLRAGSGNTALLEAARNGHLAVVAILLDRGCDHHVRNAEGDLAVDLAGRGRHAMVVRLIEARCCPFVWNITMERKGWFSTTNEDMWVAVYRARPWDNPQVNRSDVWATVYPSRDAPLPERILNRPRVEPISADGDIVIFDLTCASARLNAHTRREEPLSAIRCRLPRVIYTWLVHVLAEEFGTGRSPVFDRETGLVTLPPPAAAWAAGYSSNTLFGPLPPIAMGSPPPAVVTGPTAAPAVGGLGAYPAASAMAAATAQPLPRQQPVQAQPVVQAAQGAYPMQQFQNIQQLPLPLQQQVLAVMAQQQGQRPQAQTQAQAAQAQAASAQRTAAIQRSATASSSSSSAQTYLTPTVRALFSKLADGTLLPPGAAEPPAAFVCSITSELMLDPCVASDGFTYSRDAILQWLSSSAPEVSGTLVRSPLTGEPFTDARLVPNHALRGQIIQWIEDQQHAVANKAVAAEEKASAAVMAASIASIPPSSAPLVRGMGVSLEAGSTAPVPLRTVVAPRRTVVAPTPAPIITPAPHVPLAVPVALGPLEDDPSDDTATVVAPPLRVALPG